MTIILVIISIFLILLTGFLNYRQIIKNGNQMFIKYKNMI